MIINRLINIKLILKKSKARLVKKKKRGGNTKERTFGPQTSNSNNVTTVL